MQAMQAVERANSIRPACVTAPGQFLPGAFPYGACADQFAGGTLHIAVPLVGVAAYLLAKPACAKACEALGTTGTSSSFVALVYLHNMALCLFSLVVCVRSTSLVADSYRRLGFMDTYCATPRSTLFSDGMSFYVVLFYLSKFYEFIDTFVLVVKRKKVSLLQSYHHSGAVIAMWLLAITHSHGAIFFVCMNSFVHTVMYAYYAASVYKAESLLTAAAYRILLPLKPYLTSMQIMQFFIGVFGVFFSYFIDGCNTTAASYATAFSQIYVLPLIYLFFRFYLESYRQQKRK